jgi:hypothetical protein
MNRRVIPFLIFAAAVGIGACKKAEPPSPIVKQVEDAGAGDLGRASVESLETWFKGHARLAYEIKLRCLEAEPRRRADWTETTEGKVCKAAFGAALTGEKPIETDDRRY